MTVLVNTHYDYEGGYGICTVGSLSCFAVKTRPSMVVEAMVVDFCWNGCSLSPWLNSVKVVVTIFLRFRMDVVSLVLLCFHSLFFYGLEWCSLSFWLWEGTCICHCGLSMSGTWSLNIMII